MVQGVLVVQGGLVVLLSERSGRKRERRVYFCVRKNIWAKSESDGRVLQLVPKPALALHPPGPPSILGGLRSGARLFGKCFWLSTSSGLPTCLTGGLCWESELVTGQQMGFGCIGNGSHCLRARCIWGRGGNAKPTENRCQVLGIKNQFIVPVWWGDRRARQTPLQTEGERESLLSEQDTIWKSGILEEVWGGGKERKVQ